MMKRPFPSFARLSTLLVLAVAGTTPAVADDTALQVAARAPAFAQAAQAACNAVALPPSQPPLEIERAIRDAREEISTAVVSDETLPAAAPILEALAERIGDLDTVPSLELQMLRDALANRAGDTTRVIEGRAFVHALLEHIASSGDGATPATAWHACLIGNQRVFAQQMLQARGVARQALVHEADRHYDRLTLTMADGSTREVYFDVTDLFKRNAEALLR